MAGPGSLRVAIVGGSIGGLTAAVLLRDLGCLVEVFERSTAELEGRGAGIVVHELSVRYLVANRIADIDSLSVASHHHVHIDAGGATIHDDHIAYRYTSWNTLYRNLLRSLGPDRYHLGSAVTALHDSGREVTVSTAAGEISCDLLICADGVASTARALLQPHAQPLYAGYVGWRGTVRETELSPSARSSLEDTLLYHWTGSSLILAYMIPGTKGEVRAGRRLVNFVWYRNVPALRLSEVMTDIAGIEHSLSLPPGSVREPHLQELRQAAKALPPVLAELVLATAEPFIQKIVDVEVDSMAFGRICLLGDAAFTARPHTAAGTAKAAADAWALAEALRTHGKVGAALAAWESRQLSVGRQLVARARDLGERSQVRAGWRPDDPYQRFGLWAPGDSRLTATA
jgi:2,6-dihydroxypyridine 3-monooxygenase